MAEESKIFESLQAIVHSEDGAGDCPVPWPWVLSGEFSGGPFEVGDEEAGVEITKLVRSGKIKILVWKDQLQLQLS